MQRLSLILFFATLLGAACTNASSGLSDAAMLGTWQVKEINGESTVEDAEPTLRFSEDGTMSGSTGCNQYSASYTLKDGELTLGMMAVTERACLGPVNEQERGFLDVLGKVDRVSVNASDDLKLSASDGGYMLAQKK